MLRRLFAVFSLIAFALIGSLGLSSASAASERSFDISAVHILSAADHLAPLVALADVAVLSDRMEPSTPQVHEIAGTGPLSPVYKLSHQTDGASLASFHRRC